MLAAHPLEMTRQVHLDHRRKQGHTILLSFTSPHEDLIGAEVHVLRPEPSAFQQAQSGPVQDGRHEPRRSLELVQDGPDLLTGEDDRKPPRDLGAHDTVEPWDVSLEYRAVEEQQGAQRLVLRRRADVAADREPRKKAGDLGGSHLRGMPLPVEEDVAPDPADVRLLRPAAVVASPDRVADLVQELIAVARAFLQRFVASSPDARTPPAS
jgi:hypothetical protein